MNSWIEVLYFSIVEGITEYLPISSTAHLILLSKLLHIPQDMVNISFEISIQMAAILAVITRYRNFISLENYEFSKKLFLNLVLSFIPVGIFGFFLANYIDVLFNNILLMAGMFIFGGVVFLIIEKMYNKKEHKTKSIKDINYKQSFFVGLMQSLSLIPGTSRSGSTIVGGILSGMDRKTATEFSFLSAIPTMSAATLYTLYKNFNEISFGEWKYMVLGFVLSYIVALIVIDMFLKYVSKHNFVPFGIYRILLGIILILMYLR